jgi:hypothetical protein
MTKKKVEKKAPAKKKAPKKQKEEVIELDFEDIIDSIRDSALKKNGHVDHCSCTGCGDSEFDYDSDDDDCDEEPAGLVVVFDKTNNELMGPFGFNQLEEWLEEEENNGNELFVLKISSVAKLSFEWAMEEAELEDLL